MPLLELVEDLEPLDARHLGARQEAVVYIVHVGGRAGRVAEVFVAPDLRGQVREGIEAAKRVAALLEVARHHLAEGVVRPHLLVGDKD